MEISPQFHSFPPVLTEPNRKLRARDITTDYSKELLFILNDERRVIHTFNKQLFHLNQFTLPFVIECITAAPNANLLFLKCGISSQVYLHVIDMFSGSMITRWLFSVSYISIACDLTLSLYTCEYQSSRIKIFNVFEPVNSFLLSPSTFQLTPWVVKLCPDNHSLLVQNLEPAYFMQIYDLLGNLLKYFSHKPTEFVGGAFTTSSLNSVIVCIPQQHEIHIRNKQGSKLIKLGGFGDELGLFVHPFVIAYLPPDLYIICSESKSHPIQCIYIKQL